MVGGFYKFKKSVKISVNLLMVVDKLKQYHFYSPILDLKPSPHNHSANHTTRAIQAGQLAIFCQPISHWLFYWYNNFVITMVIRMVGDRRLSCNVNIVTYLFILKNKSFMQISCTCTKRANS